MDRTKSASDDLSRDKDWRRGSSGKREASERRHHTTSSHDSRPLDPIREMTSERSEQAANIPQASRDAQWGVSPGISSSQSFSYAPIKPWYGDSSGSQPGSSASMTYGAVPIGEQSRRAAPPLTYRPFPAASSRLPEVPDAPISKTDPGSQRQEFIEPRHLAKEQVRAAVREVRTKVSSGEKNRLEKLGKELRANIDEICAHKKGKGPERSLEELLKAACEQMKIDIKDRRMTDDTRASKLYLLREVEKNFPMRTQGGEESNNETERDYRDTPHDRDLLEGDVATASPRQIERLRQDYNTFLYRVLPENQTLYEKKYRGIVKMLKSQERGKAKDSTYSVYNELYELVEHMRIDEEVGENEKAHTRRRTSYGTLIHKVSKDNKERYEYQFSQIDGDCVKYIHESKSYVRYDEELNEDYIVNIDERRQNRDNMIRSVNEIANLTENMINEARDENRYKKRWRSASKDNTRTAPPDSETK